MAHHHNTASADTYFRQGNSLYEMELYEEAVDAYASAIRFITHIEKTLCSLKQ